MISRLSQDESNSSNGQHHTLADDEDPNQLVAAVTIQAEQLQKKAEQLIKSYPMAVLGAAVVAGMAVGWWVKRK